MVGGMYKVPLLRPLKNSRVALSYLRRPGKARKIAQGSC